MTYAYKEKYRIVKVNDNMPFFSSLIARAYKHKGDKTLLIEVPNTTYLSIDKVLSLPDDVMIRIAGPFDKEREERYHGYKFVGGLSFNEDNFNQVIYTKEETIKILNKLDEIESGINPWWPEMQKIYYVYDYLKNQLRYDPTYKIDDDSNKIRSLKGLIRKKTVCAGYAVIFKEILNRLGIGCAYIQGSTPGGNHAWNAVELYNKKIIPVDITWDNGRVFNGQMDNTKFFAQDIDLFNEEHIPFEAEDLPNIYYSSLDEEEIKKLDEVASRIQTYGSFSFKQTRDDGSSFIITQLNSNEDFYRYIYQDIKKDKSFDDPILITTTINILRPYNKNMFDKYDPDLTDEGLEKYYTRIIRMKNIRELLLNKKDINRLKERNLSYVGKLVRSKTIDYEEVKYYLNNYKIIKENNKNIIIDKTTNEKELDKSIKDLVIFSYDWLKATGINEQHIDSINRYKYIFDGLKEYINENGPVTSKTPVSAIAKFINKDAFGYKTYFILYNFLKDKRKLKYINQYMYSIKKSKDEDLIYTYKDEIRYYTREDGTKIIIIFNGSAKSKDNSTYLNKYEIIEDMKTNKKSNIKKNVIFTENDLIEENREYILDVLLNRNEIDKCATETGGYMGYIDRIGNRKYNPEWVNVIEQSAKMSLYKTRINPEYYMEEASKNIADKYLSHLNEQRRMFR